MQIENLTSGIDVVALIKRVPLDEWIPEDIKAQLTALFLRDPESFSRSTREFRTLKDVKLWCDLLGIEIFAKGVTLNGTSNETKHD